MDPQSSPRQAASSPAGGALGGAGQSAQVELLRDLPARDWTVRLRRFRELQVICDRLVRRCERQRDIAGPVIPNLQPRSPQGWLRSHGEVAVGAPGTVRDPAGLGLRPCPLAEADRRPRVRAKRDELQQVSACSVSGTFPHSYPPPRPWPRPRLQREALLRPPGAGAHRAEPADRGAEEPGLHPKRLGDVARPQAGRNRRGRAGEAPACGHRKEGELVTVQGEGAGSGKRERRPGGPSGPRLPLPHSSGTRDPRNGTPSRALPLLLPAFRTRHRCLSSPSPRNQSFRLRIWTCGNLPPHPRPLGARLRERPGGARVPRCQRRAGAAGCPYLPPDWPAASPGCSVPAGWLAGAWSPSRVRG